VSHDSNDKHLLNPFADKLKFAVQAEIESTRRLSERQVGETLVTAEELGMDEATYLTLLELQYREITPEDFQTLVVLDESLNSNLKPASRFVVID